MKTYLLIVKIYNYVDRIYEDEYIEMFSNFERAKQYGQEFLNKTLDSYSKNKNKSIQQCLKDENIDFEFTITEENIEYAEKFNKKLKFGGELEEYLVYEPTHKEYVLDYTGKITDIILSYFPNQKKVYRHNCLYMKPNDLSKNAGTKFKIGDIVKIINQKNENDRTYNYYTEYSDVYVVRYLPKRIKGQKYLKNTYALSEIKDEDFAPGIYTKEFHEEQIAKYDKKIKENSPIDVLRKIYTNDIKIDNETWRNLKYGVISLRDVDKNKSNYYKKVLNLR